MFQLVSMVILFSTSEEEEAQELANLKKHIMVTIQRKIQASLQHDNEQMEIDVDFYNGSENVAVKINSCISNVDQLAQLMEGMNRGGPPGGPPGKPNGPPEPLQKIPRRL